MFKKLKQKWLNLIDYVQYKHNLKTKEIEYFILYSCEERFNTKNIKEEDLEKEIQSKYDEIESNKEDYFPDFKKVEFECIEQEEACENLIIFTVKTTCYITSEELQNHLDYNVDDANKASGSLTTQFGFLPAISLEEYSENSNNGYLTPFFKNNNKFIFNDHLVESEFQRIYNHYH